MKTPGYRAWVAHIAAQEPGLTTASADSVVRYRRSVMNAVSELFEVPIATVERAVRAAEKRNAKEES